MRLFDVYPLFDINIVRGKGCHVWDEQGTEYLDLYGGHAVISIGHAHPHYVEMISQQVAKLWPSVWARRVAMTTINSSSSTAGRKPTRMP